MTLKKRAIKGVLWVSLSSGMVQAIKFIAKIVLTRMLLPDDFGLVAIGLFVVGCFSLLQGMGINGSLIQRRSSADIDQAANTAFILVLITGFVLWALSFLSAAPLALFFKNQAATGIIRALSFTFLISSFEIVPSALLTREIEFRKRFFPEVCSAIVYTGVSIVLAKAGYKHWSLIYGYMASVTVNAVLMWGIAGFRPSFSFNAEIARDLIGYGKYIAASVVVAFVMFQCDNAVVGRLLGVKQLGFYTMAYTIANLPSISIGLVVSGALYPVYSKLQHDPVKLRSTFLKSLKMLAVVTIPIAAGLMVMADSVITIVLGPKWMPMAASMKILSVFAVFRAMQSMTSFLLHAIGEARMDLINAIFQMIVMGVLIFPLTLRYSIDGTSIAVTLMLAGGFIRLLYLTKIKLAFSGREIFHIFFPSCLSAFAMTAVILAARSVFFRAETVYSFVFECCLGAVVYCMISIAADRRIIGQAQELLRLLAARDVSV